MFKRLETLQIQLDATVARWNTSLRRFSVFEIGERLWRVALA